MKSKWKIALSFTLVGILACSAVALVFGINQSLFELLDLLVVMLSAGVTNLRVLPVFIVILVTILFSLPLGLLTINLINIDKQSASTKFILSMSLGITLMTASFTLMGLLGIPITRITLLTNYVIILLFLLVINKRKGYWNIMNLHLNSIESRDKYIFFLFLLLFMIMIYPALRYSAPFNVDWMDYGVRIQGILHSSAITGFYFNDFVHATDPSLLFYPQGFFVFIAFLYHVSGIPVHILLLSFSYFIGFMTLLMIYALAYNFFKNNYIAALAVVSVLVIEGLSRLDTSGFTWVFSLFLSLTFVFLYYETIKKYDLKKALLTGISLSALFMSNQIVALSIFLVPISYISLFVLRGIIAKNYHLRIEYIQAHVMPLVIAMILSLPIFITNYVYMFSSAFAPSNGISSSISMRTLSNLDYIYKMNGGAWIPIMPFPELNSMAGILVFAPILMGLFFCLKQRKEYQKLITILLFSSLVTCVVLSALNYIAFLYVSAEVLFVLPFSLLSAIGISETYKLVNSSEQLKHIRISHIMILFILVFIIFGFVKISPMLVYTGYQDTGFYASSADVEAALWLKENTDTDIVVLNSPDAIRGGWIPIVSNREAVYTRLHRRISQEKWDIRAKECKSTFYQPAADTSYYIWEKHNISYIFVTSNWPNLGSFLKSPFLDLKYFGNGTAIFNVNLIGTHIENNSLVHIEAEASELYGNAMIEDITRVWFGIYVKMPDESKVVIDLVPVKNSIQRDTKNNVATIRIKHFIGPVNFPLKVSIGNETYIIDKTAEKFRFITTEITFPTKILFQENTTELTIETINRDTPLPFPFTLFRSGRFFFSFCPWVDWIQVSIARSI